MASESVSTESEESVFLVLEGVVYYVNLTTSSNAINVFVGSKERVSIPSSGKHCTLQTFVRHVVEHAGLREEADRGIVFVDTASHQVMFKTSGWRVVIVTGTGKEGNSNGKSTRP